MTTETQSENKSHKWRRILVHEMFEYFFNFAFLAFFLVSLAWYKRLLLHSYGISFTAYWAPLIEAAILAKVIMIGDALRMGRRFDNRALAVPVIYRTIVFSAFVVVFTFAERIVEAWFHHKTAAEGIAEIMDKGWYFILASYVLILVVFIPFFTMKEIERAFGEEKIRSMFFARPRPEVDSPSAGEGIPPKPMA